MTNIEQKLSVWIVARRWWFLLLMPILVLVLSVWLKDLIFNADYRVFFSEDNPQLQAFNYLERAYTQDDNVIFLLIPEDGQVFTRKTLTAVRTLTKMAWQIPYSLRVDSVSNFQHTEAKGDDLLVTHLVKKADISSDAGIQRVRDIALAEPLLVDRLVSKKADVAIVNVTIQLPRVDQTREVPEIVRASRGIADQIRAQYPHLGVHLSGIAMMNNAFTESSIGDMYFLMPVSFLVMLVALVLLLRGALGTLTTLFVIVMSILAGMGAGSYFGLPITPSSAVSPIIILTMAVANSVHVLVVFYHQLHIGRLRRNWLQEVRTYTLIERQGAMEESLRINLQPIFLTSLTTIIGFLTLNFSEVPPFRDLANFVTAGVSVSFLLSITFLPALMVILPSRARSAKSDHTVIDRFMDRLGDFVVGHRSWLLWVMGCTVLVLIAFIPRNELNDVYVRYFDESIQFRQDTDVLDKYLGGLYWIDYSLDSGESDGINDPMFLEQIDSFANWLRQQPEVVHVNTVTDIFKRLNKDLHGGDRTWYRLPAKRDLAAQCLLLYEMSLPYGLDLNNQINVDKSATRIRVSTHVLSTKDVLSLDRRARQWLSDNSPNLVTQGAGPTMMFAHIGARNIRVMLKATTVALVLISLILIVTLGSLRIGSTSMIPNLVPAGMAFGIWGMLVGEIGLALSVVTTMTIGIVVDDTIHFLSKYLRARREQGVSPEDAVRYAFSRVGTALMITSLALIAGFLVLAMSSFYLNSSMGLMTAMVLGLALIADFLFFPPLLMKLERAKG